MSLVVLLQGCSIVSKIPDEKDGWVLKSRSLLGIYNWGEVYYCQANIQKDRKPMPRCYEASNLETSQGNAQTNLLKGKNDDQ